MTQTSLGDCQHVRFSPTFFRFLNNFKLLWIFINWAALRAGLADVQFFPHCVTRTSSMIISTKSFLPSCSGKARRQTNNYEITLGFLMFCTDVLLVYLLIYQWVYFPSSSQSWNYCLFLLLFRPLFPLVFLLACFPPPWLVASARPIANSKNAVTAYISIHACRTPQRHQPAWEHTGEGEQKTWEGQQPPSWWALGRWCCLFALHVITSCRQLSFPAFRHLGGAAQGRDLWPCPWLSILFISTHVRDTLLSWAVWPSRLPAHPSAPVASFRIHQLPGRLQGGWAHGHNAGWREKSTNPEGLQARSVRRVAGEHSWAAAGGCRENFVRLRFQLPSPVSKANHSLVTLMHRFAVILTVMILKYFSLFLYHRVFKKPPVLYFSKIPL